jgi:hypothetical protein
MPSTCSGVGDSDGLGNPDLTAGLPNDLTKPSKSPPHMMVSQQGVTGTSTHFPVSHPEQHLAFQNVKDLVFIEVDVERW